MTGFRRKLAVSETHRFYGSSTRPVTSYTRRTTHTLDSKIYLRREKGKHLKDIKHCNARKFESLLALFSEWVTPSDFAPGSTPFHFFFFAAIIYKPKDERDEHEGKNYGWTRRVRSFTPLNLLLYFVILDYKMWLVRPHHSVKSRRCKSALSVKKTTFPLTRRSREWICHTPGEQIHLPEGVRLPS